VNDETRVAGERAALSAVLDVAGLLLADPAATWLRWMQRHPDHADVIAVTYEMVSVLKHDTNWQKKVLLERLGCTVRAESDLEGLGVDQLRLCAAYFTWVHDLMECVDTYEDRRGIVEVGRRVLLAADGDVEAARAAVDDGGDFPASEYLRLGELTRATRAAIATLDTPEGQRARDLESEHPLRDILVAHLSQSRVILLDERPAVLGERVAVRMRRHLNGCDLCRSTVPSDRRERLLVDRQPAAA
jgi:hypothetical protein